MSQLAALLVRRLCHDFAGPTGAIATAVEMLGDSADPELLGLAVDSSAALSAALELYRYVLTPPPEPVGGGRARALLAGWLAAKGDLGLDWPDDDTPWPAGVAALTAGLAMVAADAARGGKLVVSEGRVGIAGATLPSDVAAALAGAEVTTTGAALAGVLADMAAGMGGSIAAVAAPLALAYQSSRLPD